MPRVAVIPGSFDPVTLGHLDIVRRAAPLFDRLHVLVTHNPGKAALLPFTQRVALLRQAIADAGIEGTWSSTRGASACSSTTASRSGPRCS